MTRYTNFARKRTYVQAGFNNEPKEEAEVAPVTTADPSGDATAEPEKKKRKRGDSKKTKLSDGANPAPTSREDGDGGAEDGEASTERRPKKTRHGDMGQKRDRFDKRKPKGMLKFHQEDLCVHSSYTQMRMPVNLPQNSADSSVSTTGILRLSASLAEREGILRETARTDWRRILSKASGISPPRSPVGMLLGYATGASFLDTP